MSPSAMNMGTFGQLIQVAEDHSQCCRGPGEPQMMHLVAHCTNPAGTLVLQHIPGSTGYSIVQAAPRLDFSDELLMEEFIVPERRLYGDTITVERRSHVEKSHDECWAQWMPGRSPEERYRHAPYVCFRDAIVRVKGEDRTVVYVVRSYNPKMHVWRASWPD